MEWEYADRIGGQDKFLTYFFSCRAKMFEAPLRFSYSMATMALQKGGGKLPGKTEYSGRRRSATRKSGFHAHQDSTGGEFQVQLVDSIHLQNGESITVGFSFPAYRGLHFMGFGGWFCATKADIKVEMLGPPNFTLTTFNYPCWNKFGSMWLPSESKTAEAHVKFTAQAHLDIALYGISCGRIEHKHLRDARVELLTNMYQFSPEALFLADEGRITWPQHKKLAGKSIEITLKSCNRCARHLPINTHHERDHLSFSNHCVAPHRRPCKHHGFGTLHNPDTNVDLKLDYGFQLECRFCKKFEVNAAHNPKRTAAQMKEDAARRRGFELLIEALFEGTPQLRYRHTTGRELADVIYEKFCGKCFNCAQPFTSRNQMHLDHTRPLALLWPLDETATALCGECNSQKRDRYPSDFYSLKQLSKLAEIVGLSPETLAKPSPNMSAVKRFLGKIDWFYSDFLQSKEMRKVRDGKVTGELLVKALQKVLENCPGGAKVDLPALYNRRR